MNKSKSNSGSPSSNPPHWRKRNVIKLSFSRATPLESNVYSDVKSINMRPHRGRTFLNLMTLGASVRLYLVF